jgi:deoxyadenosine/deoxycytidine kinase
MRGLGMDRKDVFVALAGNIGAGKTTAAKILSRHLGMELFAEPVVDNRFLAAYYGDMKRWAFTLQLEFLIRRIEHHELIHTVPKACVQDRSLIEDPEIFAKYLHGLGNMSDSELDLYLEYFRRLTQKVRQPDLVIFLKGDEQTSMDRIQVRGRKEEVGITLDFLAGLRAYYDTFEGVARQKYGLNLLTIDLKTLDMRTPQGEEQVIALVRDALGWSS